ncbi:MAG TPA: DUF2167 domain-containing protein [Xanthomonadales bacterium]|nr:DUF2167 domain-containing protein [Xanthomonadales bacterium]
MRLFALLTAVFLATTVHAQTPAEAEAANPAEAFVATLKFQDGTVNLPQAKATLTLPQGFRFLDAADAERVLSELWGNPPGSEAIGMLVPAATSLADAEASWAIVLQYDDDGYVSDEDAKDIDYGEMLVDMKEEASASNEERQQQGFGAVELVGWAETPRYDAAAHKLHWAKEIAFEGEDAHTLNYDVRVLGRHGVLVMRAVASIGQLASIKPGMSEAIAAVEFDQGARYADFNPDSDRTAEYGLAALVAGGVAAKSGLLTKLLALLFAAKKLVIAGVAAIGYGIMKVFGKKKDAGAG